MAISKIKLGKARTALTQAGMSPALATQAVKLLDLDQPLEPQITALAEEDPELFGMDADGNPLDPSETDAEDERPMTAAEAKRARLSGGHRLRAVRPEGQTSAETNAQALGAGRPRQPRTSTAPATAQKAAERLRAGVGRAADL